MARHFFGSILSLGLIFIGSYGASAQVGGPAPPGMQTTIIEQTTILLLPIVAGPAIKSGMGAHETRTIEIRPAGDVWAFYSSSPGDPGRWTRMARALLRRDEAGHASWVYDGAVNSPMRAQKYDVKVKSSKQPSAASRIDQGVKVGDKIAPGTTATSVPVARPQSRP